MLARAVPSGLREQFRELDQRIGQCDMEDARTGPAERRHANVAAVALAATHARIAWALLAKGLEYRPAGPQVVAA